MTSKNRKFIFNNIQCKESDRHNFWMEVEYGTDEFNQVSLKFMRFCGHSTTHVFPTEYIANMYIDSIRYLTEV